MSVYFGSINHIQNRMHHLIEQENIKHILIIGTGINFIDLSGAEALVTDAKRRRDNLQYSVIFICLLVVFGGVAGLGFVKVSPRVAEGLIFFSFLILFEFVLVLADPMIDKYSGGAPGYKLLFNALLAGVIFPLHAFFERLLKSRLVQ